MGTSVLTYERLREAVAGKAYAFRAVTDLLPAGGEGDKVFPPTYEGSVYARETRMIDGEPVDCVLLDSVQSQANRLELALLDWHRDSGEGEPPFPLVQIDFSGTDADEVGIFTVLEAPHRIADAVFTACETEDGQPFRSPKNTKKSSEIGRIVDEASSSNSTGLFGLCPTALIFGMWDSHGSRGGLGEKFQRMITSEIIGCHASSENRRPASRIDPLIKVAGQSLPIQKKDDGTWEVNDKGKNKLSEVGLGNVTPSLKVPKTNEYNHGGVTIRFARQIAVLSLPALRRLRFPLKEGQAGVSSGEVDVAARTTLAALALAALSRQWELGYSLRSRCDLIPESEPQLELIAPGGEERFELPFEKADGMLRAASSHARSVGLPWPTGEGEGPWTKGVLTLKPNKELVKAVARSRELAAEQRGE